MKKKDDIEEIKENLKKLLTEDDVRVIVDNNISLSDFLKPLKEYEP